MKSELAVSMLDHDLGAVAMKKNVQFAATVSFIGLSLSLAVLRFDTFTTAMIVSSLVMAGMFYYYADTAIGSGSYKLPQNLKRLSGRLPILGDTVQILNNIETTHDGQLRTYFFNFKSSHGIYVKRFVLVAHELNKSKPIHISLPFRNPIILINDPKLIEHVLKTNFTTYEKGQYCHSRMFDVLGDGIFNADGETWRTQRKNAANIFNVKNFRSFVGVVFADVMKVFSERLVCLAESGKAFDLQDMFFRFTLDSFCKVAFDVDLKCMVLEETLPFVKAFDQAQNCMKGRFTNPVWELEEMWTQKGVNQRRNCKIIDDFAKEVIAKRRADENMSGSDLLSLLMKSLADQPSSDDVLAKYAINFIIAGMYHFEKHVHFQ